MGRKNKNYSIDLHQQAYNKLTAMQAFGESKKQAIENGTDKDKIFSFNTYKTYWKHIKYFTKWIQDNHPECTTLKAARKHINEWLQTRVDQELSAWTIQTEAKALGKLYGIQPDDPDYFQPPKRRRQDIKRSRVDAERDRHFSITNNDEFIKFCKGVGGRRAAIEKLKADDLWSRSEMEEELRKAEMGKGIIIGDGDENVIENIKDALKVFPDQDYFIHFVRDKGGRSRFSPIVGKNKQQIIERMENTPSGEKVWQRVPKNADIHSYRGDYATYIYKKYARKIEDIPYDKVNKGTGKAYQSGVYVCRKDESGKKLDKEAMLICSKALGHNRLEVVANNYIRGL